MGSFWGVHPVPRESTKLAKFSTELNLLRTRGRRIEGAQFSDYRSQGVGSTAACDATPLRGAARTEYNVGGCWARDVHRYSGLHLDDVVLALFPSSQSLYQPLHNSRQVVNISMFMFPRGAPSASGLAGVVVPRGWPSALNPAPWFRPREARPSNFGAGGSPRLVSVTTHVTNYGLGRDTGKGEIGNRRHSHYM